MRIDDALQGVTHLFLDSAPVIYYLEKNPHYFALVKAVFQRIDVGMVTAVTSPVTLAEDLVIPYRSGLSALQQEFIDLIVYGDNTIFAAIDQDCAIRAAQLRASYNIGLLDALQIAVALAAGCQAFLTNDRVLRRVVELRMLILDDLELS